MKAGTCRHFSGIMNKACDVGVEYASVRDHDVRPYRFPCLGSPACITKCEKFDAITDLEAAEWMVKVNKTIDSTFVARNAIVAVIGKWKRGAYDEGKMTCPICKAGTLSYTRSDYNGHIHAACSTPDCVRWME